jgi:predicted alpha/beta hydrolase family esterase
MSDQTVLLLHGWGGNKPEHWQEWLYKELSDAGVDVRYPKMPSPGAPKLPAWLVNVHAAVQDLPDFGKVTVLCHSLGAITWMHYVTSLDRQVADRVLLVAPPYVCSVIPPADTPPGIASFFPPPLDAAAVKQAARETTIICGEADCYGTEDQTKAYADRLEVPMHLLCGAGHVSPYWGYGAWPWVRDWCLGKSGMPPEPNG